MTIQITMRQLGRKRGVSGVAFHLEHQPHTLRELIEEAVHTCVAAYNARVRGGGAAIPMSEERARELEAIGKLAFDLVDGGREADEGASAASALQGFRDGLFRVFHGQTELTELDAPLTLREQDEVTMIRLTLLTGRMW